MLGRPAAVEWRELRSRNTEPRSCDYACVAGPEVSIYDNRICGDAIEVTHGRTVFITRARPGGVFFSNRVLTGDEEMVAITEGGGPPFRVGVATDIDDPPTRRAWAARER